LGSHILRKLDGTDAWVCLGNNQGLRVAQENDVPFLRWLKTASLPWRAFLLVADRRSLRSLPCAVPHSCDSARFRKIVAEEIEVERVVRSHPYSVEKLWSEKQNLHESALLFLFVRQPRFHIIVEREISRKSSLDSREPSFSTE